MNPAGLLATLLADIVPHRELRLDHPTMAAILDEAARFARDVLTPFAPAGDRLGATLVEGAVITAAGHRPAWQAFATAGWPGLTVPEAYGGQGLPLALALAAQMLMDGVDPAFGMLAINTRCAARLLAAHADEATREAWLPRLADGSWTASICISESGAGSDVGRIRTKVELDGAGAVRITGEKCWISYGGHDLSARIGHFVLAREPDGALGTRGLSLFLVPDRMTDGSANAVSVLRIEEKLGLHASPTCTLRFDGAVGTPLGPAGRGLPTLFAMVVAMRLAVAAQGAAVARAASDIAETYARERLQGGPAAQPPRPIDEHADIRRLLLTARVRAEASCLLALEAAASIDAGDAGDAAAAARGALLLPLAKTVGAQAGFANADAAIQVLGGAGYAADFPVERLLRDCRVFAIYEGTTGMQAMDLLLRRVLPDGGVVLRDVLAHLEPAPLLADAVLDAAGWATTQPQRAQETAATPFLQLLGLACADGLLRRAGRLPGPLGARYSALAAFHFGEASAKAAVLSARCREPWLDHAYEAALAGVPPREGALT